ncbi:hypothetical protein JCM3766R1_000453 [Sporobolomyces carnicolor]
MVQLFNDILTRVELFSDMFPIKEVDGIAYEVDTKMITPKSESLFDSSSEFEDPIPEVVWRCHLSEIDCSKTDYIKRLKKYLGDLSSKLQESGSEDLEAFQNGVNSFAKKTIDDFDKYKVYLGENDDQVFSKGMPVLLGQRDNGEPYLIYWKHGVVEEKY